MDKKAFELYYYMNSYESIQKWLKEEGVKTKKEAIKKLKQFSLSAEVAISKMSVVDKKIIDKSGTFWEKVLSPFE